MKGFHHVGFTVSNLERTIDFYHNLLGLVAYTRPEERAAAIQAYRKSRGWLR
jgi:catechol 2,3-dioxygenase-like lactoylglutathione lyase family enzyme